MVEVAERKAGQGIAPVRSYGEGGAQDERAFAEVDVGHGEARRGPGAAAPQHDIKVEYARGPGLPAAEAAELALDLVQAMEQFGRRERRRYDGGGIGIAAARRADRGRSHRPRCWTSLQADPPEPRQGFLQHLFGRAEPVVALVRAEGDEIAVPAQISSQMRV